MASRFQLIGQVNDRAKKDFLADAAALLFPVDWPEPFGLVMIEAMACGTPIIAFGRGSVPEVIDDGKTGTIVENKAGALEASKRLKDLDRRGVRNVFERACLVLDDEPRLSVIDDFRHRAPSKRNDRGLARRASIITKPKAVGSRRETASARKYAGPR